MSFRLYKHNYRGPKLHSPDLSDILADTQPFVITSLPYDGRKRRDYVFAELFDAPEFLLKGMGFLDHDLGVTYFLKKGETIFKPVADRIRGPWHRDKFGVFANWYETPCPELRSQFEACGYSFEGR